MPCCQLEQSGIMPLTLLSPKAMLRNEGIHAIACHHCLSMMAVQDCLNAIRIVKCVPVYLAPICLPLHTLDFHVLPYLCLAFMVPKSLLCHPP
mmetsp:Transcript_9505/g.18389  ORF Transcript_9505/g.18389 Transcript_9505/m.18389 type:complete len:93 (-) Transcript_9505:283-561(-)